MRSKHGFKLISSIPKDYVQILHESWIEFANKRHPNEKDRAGNITYSIDGLGKVTLSHSSGSIVIDTNYDEMYVKETMKKWLSMEAYKIFELNLRDEELGLHFKKYHGTVGFNLNVKEPGKYPIWVSCRVCNGYFDVHIKVPSKKVSIEGLPKNGYIPTSNPKRKYVSDIDVLNLVGKNGVVNPKYGYALNLSESQFYRRLEKLRTMKKVKKTSRYPALYMINN
jgi:hypothetical protein